LEPLVGKRNDITKQLEKLIAVLLLRFLNQINSFDKLWLQLFNFKVSSASYKLSCFLFVIRKKCFVGGFSNNAQVLFQLVQEIWNSKLFFLPLLLC
jgi:hypothetical protein